MNLCRGERHHAARLTEPQVRELRRQHFHHGVSVHALAHKHRLPARTVYDAVHYRTWKHVKEEPTP